MVMNVFEREEMFGLSQGSFGPWDLFSLFNETPSPKDVLLSSDDSGPFTMQSTVSKKEGAQNPAVTGLIQHNTKKEAHDKLDSEGREVGPAEDQKEGILEEPLGEIIAVENIKSIKGKRDTRKREPIINLKPLHETEKFRSVLKKVITGSTSGKRTFFSALFGDIASGQYPELRPLLLGLSFDFKESSKTRRKHAKRYNGDDVQKAAVYDKRTGGYVICRAGPIIDVMKEIGRSNTLKSIKKFFGESLELRPVREREEIAGVVGHEKGRESEDLLIYYQRED